jgi:hypothetical protein
VAEPVATPEPAAEADEAQPSKVTIQLKGLPPGARATFEGKPVMTPFAVDRSDEPGVLKVTAPGHWPYKSEIARDEDQNLTVKMVKKAGGKGGKKGAGWKPNPFD